MTGEPMDMIEQVLRDRGPCLSTALATHLMDLHGLTREAARKRISRQPPNVRRLAYLKFPRNARFVYLQEQYGSPWFWDALVKALLETSPAYGGAIAALRQRGSLMPKAHFLIACGSPLAQLRHLSPQTVLDRLTQAKLLEEFDVPGVGICVARAQERAYYADVIPEMQARLVCEDILLKAVRGWARSLGLVSYDKVKIRGEDERLPQVGTFAWDLTGPSYLGGLVDYSLNGKPNPGFLVCDILLDHEVSAAGLAPFLQKCRTLRSLKKIGRCLQLFIADKYDNEAFQLAKSQGIMPGTPATLFGEEVAACLKHLSEVLRQAAVLALDGKVFDELFKGLSRIEGAATNLRGALFEFWSAEVIRQSYSAHIRMNRIFSDENGNKAEVDVQATIASSQIRFYECKGYQPGGLIPEAEIERWLEKRIPLVYKQAQNNQEWRGRKFHFEFWTTGRLSAVSIAKIESAKATIRPSRYTIDYSDSENIIETARSTGDHAFINSLHQHFLGHPIAKIKHAEDRKRESRAAVAAEEILLEEVVVLSEDAQIFATDIASSSSLLKK